MGAAPMTILPGPAFHGPRENSHGGCALRPTSSEPRPHHRLRASPNKRQAAIPPQLSPSRRPACRRIRRQISTGRQQPTTSPPRLFSTTSYILGFPVQFHAIISVSEYNTFCIAIQAHFFSYLQIFYRALLCPGDSPSICFAKTDPPLQSGILRCILYTN